MKLLNRREGMNSLTLDPTRTDTAVRDSVPEGDYVSQAVGLGPTTLWSYALRVSAHETTDIGTQCER
jgi:hypothetical protein